MIDGILYKENGTVLLYPKINTFVYNRPITRTSYDLNSEYDPKKPEIIYFGITRKRADQINYSSYRDESEYKSIEYTVHYPDESTVFYGLRGKNNSYYFSSKQKGFFIKPASGIIQLDSKPWVLHPFIYHNETSGFSTFNMAISTNDGVVEDSQDVYINSSITNFTPLISSEYYVNEILKVRRDEKTGDLFAYFLATPTKNVSRSESSSMESVICLTCPEENSDGGLKNSEIHPQCLWADVKMSSLGDYYILNCKGPDVPWTIIVNTETNFVLLNLNENEEVRNWDSLTKTPRVHEFELNLEDGFIGRVRIYSPLDWHPSIKNCPKKYKLLLHVDGTPEGQIVTSKYQISWLWELILNKNFIVVEADVSGSGYKNLETSNSIWREIGTLEIEDQIFVINHILEKFNCIDPDQIAVYGEVFGGYTALNIMAMDGNNLFKCCAAVSPITTWQHYSHDFAIKMFGGKYNNITKSSYEKANLSSRISGLRDKNFIIYSATMDQEILKYHVHNFLIALADNGILFKHHQYIDEGHYISNYRLHLYKHIDKYFENCFAKKN
ncbi:venom dipeptidyl peptidase 4-like [Leptopilina heterotoma]|uniref:venom dipeptidyl peptidase 4-like n=1 Tax=Leptopilina heterotoma TaxID=63436 RepID=UPI001CA8100A|nr:venom dipeptidyl peptidase 4-like [Leptopilina heterotoma]